MPDAGARCLGVVGPGLMGLGIAQVAAAAGMRVVLAGRDAASAQAGHQRLADQLARQVARGRLASDAAQARLASVTPAASVADLRDCDVAIESVPEDRALKLAVLQQMAAVLPAGALVATNTSGLPITGLASAVRDPGRFLGLHFFSPVERMPLVEVVRGAATAPAALAEALAFVRQLGQQPVAVRDGPGFFTSRVFAAYLDEALALVGEGVAPALIDEAGRALGRPIGPLAVLDEVSLALNLQQARQARADGLAERFCRPLAEPVLARLVAQGRGGRRQGGGFYEASGEGARPLWSGLAALFPPAPLQPSLQQVGQRLRAVEVMEALRCLEEGVIDSADDADTASRLGLGFPAEHGGVLGWVEHHGLSRFVDEARALAAAHGARFQPSGWLRELAWRGQSLSGWRKRPPEE